MPSRTRRRPSVETDRFAEFVLVATMTAHRGAAAEVLAGWCSYTDARAGTLHEVRGSQLSCLATVGSASWSRSLGTGDGLPGWVAATGQSRVLDSPQDPPVGRELGDRGSALAIVGRADGVVRCVITVEAPAERAFAESLVPKLELVADIVAEGLEIAGHVAAARELEHRLLTMLNHELRTPLTTLVGSLEVLASGRVNHDPAQWKALAEIGARAGQRLTHCIEMLSLAATIDSGQLTAPRERVELDTLLRGLAEHWPAEIDLRVDPTLVVEATADLLGTAVSELVDNAVRHGAVPVTVSAAIHGDRVCIDITDHGAGLSDDEIERYSERFARGDIDVLTAAGTGVGLWLTQQVAEAMGGSLELWRGDGDVHATIWLEAAGAPLRDSPS